jgi:hypothetical protein
MTRFLPLLVGVAAVVASAFDSGRQTGRWGQSSDLKAAADRVALVKESFGDWNSTPRQLDARQLKVAGVVGYISRLYVNPATGAKTQVLLICGRPGQIAVHEPDICYGAAGYGRVGELSKLKVGDDEFKVGKFVKGPPNPDALRIVWGWTTGDGKWLAPDNPRGSFGRNTGALYKVYVIRQSEAADADAVEDPALPFLNELLPELKRSLAPNP